MPIAALTSVFWGQEDENLPTLLENRRVQESHMTPNQRKIKYYRRYSKAKVKALLSSTWTFTTVGINNTFTRAYEIPNGPAMDTSSHSL